MSQKTEQDSRPIAEAVDLPEISVEHSTEFLTGSAPCAGVSRPLPAAWLGQRGIYRSRLEAVCNGEQLVDPLTLGELIQHAWRYLYLTRRAGLGLKPARQPLTSTTKTPEATDAAVDQMIAEEDADIRQDLTQQAEAERPEVVAWQYRVTAGPQTGWSLWHPGKGEEFERSYTVERRPLMTVAQHECIVGELRAENAKLSEDLNRLSIIRARLNLRLDFALDKISKLESRWPHGESPEERFEHYISNTIDRAPEPLRRLGNWLSHVLDEDQWTTAERMLTGACVAAEERAAAQTQHSVPEGWKLVPVDPTEDLLEAIHNGGYVGDDRELRQFYQAILDAAPAPGGE
ncbi:TPA: hypothetical protein L4S12_000987 [Pseudomonas aeruginosa]|nr:hypothetical protein [Pseudomonas aeruginosa]